MFAEVEQQIVDRLRAMLPPEVHVATEHELDRVPELRQKAPAAWVIYDGYSVGETIGTTARLQQIRMEWFIVATAKSARGGGSSQAARDEAAAIASQILAALLEHDLGGGKYLHLADAPGPAYDSGYAHVPMAFWTEVTFAGRL